MNLNSTHHNEDDKPTWGFSSNLLSQFVIPFGSVLIAVITILSSKAALPTWAFYLVMIYIAVVVILSLVYPIGNVLGCLQKAFRRRRIARHFRGNLLSSAKELHELANAQATYSPFHVFQTVVSWDELRDKKFPVAPALMIHNWIESLVERLDTKRKKDFPAIAKDLGLIFYHYNQHCIDAQVRLENLLSTGTIKPERLKELKQQWTISREKHLDVINRWQQLAKRINNEGREYIVGDYYDPLKTLE